MADENESKLHLMPERIKNYFKFKIWNRVWRRPIAHLTRVGDEEIILEKEWKHYRQHLSSMLSHLSSVEEMMESVGERLWKEVTDMYSEMGPYDPQTAATERDLLDSGTAKKWDIEGNIHEKTTEELMEKYGMEWWPLPMKMYDGRTKVFKFPFPQGVPLVHARGHIEVVRYYGRQGRDGAMNLYIKLLNEIVDEYESQAEHIQDENIKKIFKKGLNALRATDTLFSNFADKIMEIEEKWRGYLESFAPNKGGAKLISLKEEIISNSPTTQGKVRYRRTFKRIKTVALPIRFKAERELKEGRVEINERYEPDKIEEGVWIGNAEKKMKELAKSLNAPEQPENHVREFFKAGYYEDGKLHLLENEGGWEPVKGKGLRGEEYEVGFDKYGYPLEVNEDGKVLIDIFNNDRPIRKVPKKYIEDMSVLDIVNYVHNEWDSYRDDLRDGRYHPRSPTAIEYVMAMAPIKKPEFVKIIRKGGKEKRLWRLPLKKINTNTRGYEMKGQKGEILQRGDREPSNLSPALDLNRIGKEVEHPGRKYYHAWPGSVEMGVEVDEAEEGAVTTRGLSTFLINAITLSMKKESDIDETFKFFEAYDYAPRKFGAAYPRNPHKLQNIADLNRGGD